MNAKYKYWCYDNGTGTVPIINSVEVEVCAFGEEIALKNVQQVIKRNVYKLLTVEIYPKT